MLGKIKSATYTGSIIAFLVDPLILTNFNSAQFNTVAMIWLVAVGVTLLGFGLSAPIAICSPVYSQLRNDLIPSQSSITTISLLSIGDSLFDFLILGALGLWTNTTFENVMMVSLALAMCPIRQDIRYNRG